jgi:cob(I)alamin adenosyltransferase
MILTTARQATAQTELNRIQSALKSPTLVTARNYIDQVSGGIAFYANQGDDIAEEKIRSKIRKINQVLATAQAEISATAPIGEDELLVNLIGLPDPTQPE